MYAFVSIIDKVRLRQASLFSCSFMGVQADDWGNGDRSKANPVHG